MSAFSERNRPAIGITTNVTLDRIRSWDNSKLYSQTFNYSDAIHEAGGTALFIPQMKDPNSSISQDALDGAFNVLDGILLAGGVDVNPELYGEKPHAETKLWSDAQDSTELRLLGLAKANKIPLLAICRGMQIWNVSNGGTLHQHLPDLGLALDHVNHDKELVNRLHKVTVDKTSTLGRVLLPGTVELSIDVDSHHHQAIKELGRDLRAVAWSGDIAEGVETTIEDWFALGVQWHPESMEEAFRSLFETFVSAATGVSRELRVAA